MRIEKEFYLQTDVVDIARQLVGKTLCTRIDSVYTAATIIETEAYSYREKGCHAYNYRRTNRTETMFEAGGVAYVYLCYGIHQLFNIVTNTKGQPEAVLVRAVSPLSGEKFMEQRRNLKGKALTSGPGKLTRALGIERRHNGISLLEDEIWLEQGMVIADKDIVATARVGIDYAGEDALLPWRFYLDGNKYVSKA